MSRAKRIFIVADITYNPVKMFIDQTRKLAKGFIRLGHDVYIFSYRTALFNLSPIKSKSFAERFFKSQADELLADQAKNYSPDIVYVLFPRVLDAETIARCRQAAPSAVFMGTDGDLWPQLRRNRMEAARKLDVLTATNDGEYLQSYKDSGVPCCVFMPNLCDPDVDHRYEVSEKWKTDILWTGTAQHSADPGDTLRAELVNKLAQQKNCTLYGCCGRPKVTGINYLYAISGARIGVNVNAINSVRLYHSDRLTHYLSCGTFVLAKRVPDTDLLFRDGQHVRYFDTIEEFFDLANSYLNHEAERKKIADSGMQWAHGQFNCVKIAGYLLELAERGAYTAPWLSG